MLILMQIKYPFLHTRGYFKSQHQSLDVQHDRSVILFVAGWDRGWKGQERNRGFFFFIDK